MVRAAACHERILARFLSSGPSPTALLCDMRCAVLVSDCYAWSQSRPHRLSYATPLLSISVSHPRPWTRCRLLRAMHHALAARSLVGVGDWVG
eukprot:1091224-Rhodomonas_salina.1